MSSTTVDPGSGTSADADHGDDHADHPTDKKYIQIALILGVLTALEVATAFEAVEDLLGKALIPTLVLLMFIKFWFVVMWFMHLRFDHKVLQQLFFFGMGLATVVYFIALAAFDFWF